MLACVMGTYTDEITEIKAKINAGLTSGTVDGQSATFDLDALRKRLRELESLQADEDGVGRKRRRSSNINLNGRAW